MGLRPAACKGLVLELGLGNRREVLHTLLYHADSEGLLVLAPFVVRDLVIGGIGVGGASVWIGQAVQTKFVRRRFRAAMGVDVLVRDVNTSGE